MALILKNPIAKLHKDEKHIQVPKTKTKKAKNESKTKRHKRKNK